LTAQRRIRFDGDDGEAFLEIEFRIPTIVTADVEDQGMRGQ
jgi:hypothetical protein